MANFNTHFKCSMALSGAISATFLCNDAIELNTALWLWFVGSLGGLFPDIDSDNSTSLEVIYGLISLTFCFATVGYVTGDNFDEISLLELLFLPTLVYLVINVLCLTVLKKITVHRGNCHSLIFGLASAVVILNLTFLLADEKSDQADTIAWLTGMIFLIGYLSHIFLDELNSIEFSSFRVKSSFGTAAKTFASGVFYNILLTIIIIGGWMIAPESEDFREVLTNWNEFKVL